MDELVLKIDHLNPFALSISYHEDTKYYVPFVLPGETVRVRPRLKRKNGILCDLVEVLESSADRVKPLCPYYQDCGGCDMQHMSYEAELRFKQNWLNETSPLFANAQMAPIIASPEPCFYRNRITLHSDGKHLGYYRRGTHDIIAIRECVIASKKLNEKLAALHLDDFDKNESLELREDDGTVFNQVNSNMNTFLIDTVKKFAGGQKSQRVLELYAGRGNITFSLAELAREVIAVEGSAEAVRQAEQHRIELNLKKIKFIQNDVFQAVYKFKLDYENFDLIVCDPPRGGLANAIDVIPELNAKKIIYVSCDRTTLERDLMFLTQKNYKVRQIQPLDMFPRTHHIELVTLLEKGP